MLRSRALQALAQAVELLRQDGEKAPQGCEVARVPEQEYGHRQQQPANAQPLAEAQAPQQDSLQCAEEVVDADAALVTGGCTVCPEQQAQQGSCKHAATMCRITAGAAAAAGPHAPRRTCSESGLQAHLGAERGAATSTGGAQPQQASKEHTD